MSSRLAALVKRTIQLPPIPKEQDQRTRSWMTAVGDTFKKLLTGDDRVATVRELVDAGIAAQGSGGVLVPGPGSSITTVPAAITGLTAIGAMDNVFLSWDAPGASNFAYTEVWRASTDDLGAATKIGTTAAAVYVDAVGEGASRYYWVRAVSKANVIGPFNGSAGTRGTTGRDPTFVMSLLTGTSWQANSTYVPFQYVRPTTPNGFQYRCIDGGVSAAVEPTWPTVVGNTVNDNTVQWECVALTAAIPFVIGIIDGQPAVAMSGAFIEDATIRNAKIHSLAADKITAGQLVAGEYIQVGGSIWAGYNGYRAESYGGPAGFWMGLLGGVPRLQMTSAGDPPVGSTPPTYKRFTFDGYTFKLYNVDFISSADGEFDDLNVDVLSANRVAAEVGVFEEYLIPTDFNTYGNDDPIYYNYLAYDAVIRKGVSASLFGLVGNGGYRGPLVVTTAANAGLLPYNEPSASRYHFVGSDIAFAVRIDSGLGNGFGGVSTFLGGNHGLILQIRDQTNAVKFSINLTGSILNGTFNGVGADGSSPIEVAVSGGNAGAVHRYALIVCESDEGLMGYTNGMRLHARLVYNYKPDWPPSSDFDVYSTVTLDFQLVSFPRLAYETDDELTI